MVLTVPKSIKEATIRVMNSLPSGQRFHGHELHDWVARIYPPAEFKYPDTILRIARMYCRSQFKVVKRSLSLYEKI